MGKKKWDMPVVNKPVQELHDFSWINEYKIKSDKQRSFLIAYSVLGNVTAASRASHVSRKSHYEWINDQAEAERYKAAFEDAHRQACDAIDIEIYDRAMRGVRTAKWHNGKIVGFEYVKDTTLLIFYAKGAMPEKYKDRLHADLTGKLTLEQLVVESYKPKEKEPKK